MGIARDITERKRLEEERGKIVELKERDRLKTEFLSMISHELRTPKTPAKGCLSLLLQGIAGLLNDKQKEFVQKIDKQYDHLLLIIDGVLDFARIETGKKLTIKKELILLRRSVEEVLDSLAENFKTRGITVKTDFSGSMSTVLGDPVKINRVITNILGNSLKFVPYGGGLLDRFSQYVRVKVGCMSSGD